MNIIEESYYVTKHNKHKFSKKQLSYSGFVRLDERSLWLLEDKARSNKFCLSVLCFHEERGYISERQFEVLRKFLDIFAIELAVIDVILLNRDAKNKLQYTNKQTNK